MGTNPSKLPPLDPARVATVAEHGGEITPLDPIGARVRGIDLSAESEHPAEVVDALE